METSPATTPIQGSARASAANITDSLPEHLRGGLADVGAAATDDPGLEPDRATARSDPLDDRPDLDHVSGADRCLELDIGVRREEPFVAVGTGADLGRHVAEQGQAAGAVDEVAGVVRMAEGHVTAVDDGQPGPGTRRRT